MPPDSLHRSAPVSTAHRTRPARSFAGALALTFSLFLAGPASGQVVSHGFEDGTEGWMPRGGVTVASSTDTARDGARSLKTTGRTQTWEGPALDLRTRLAPDATYQISGWVRLASGEPASALKFTVERTPVGGSTSYTPLNAEQTVTDAAWVLLQGNFTFPAGDHTTVVLYLESSHATAAYHLDSFTITALTAAGCPEPPDQTGIYTDFESDTPQGWGPRGSAVLTTTDALAASGTRSLAVTGRTQSWNGPTINALCKLHKGSKYLISVRVRLLPGEPASSVRVSFQTGLAGTTSYVTVIGDTPVTDAAWVELSTEYTFGLDVDQLQIYVETASGTASFAIDDFLVANVPIKPIEDLPPLKDVLSDYFPIGTAIEPNELGGVHRDLLLRHFSQFTAGNSMKWDALQPAEGQFSFARADALAAFARTHGLRMRGHTLIWHNQTPAWVFRDAEGNPLQPGNAGHRDLLLQRMETHIHTVVSRYADIVDAWDVVNEVIDESQPGGLRNSPWLQIIGPEFIDRAFQFAAEAAAGARLYINDYNTESPAKRDALRTVVEGLLARGVPVDGVGHQMHINLAWPSLANIRQTIETFAALDLDNEVTELDVSVYTNSTDTAPPAPERLVEQGYRYRDLFDLLRELSPHLSSVTFWGMGDDNTWLKTFPIARDDKPLLFDEELQAKPAYWGVVDPSRLPLIPKELNITEARARINGATESFWGAIAARSLTDAAAEDSWASFRATWSGSTVFVLIDVHDATPSPEDTVDLYLGASRFTFAGEGRQRPGGADGLLARRDGAYRLKAALPAGQVLATGDLLLFDVRVTDSATGARVSWSNTHHTQDTTVDDHGTLALIPRKKVARTLRGTPVIDGQVDRAWSRAEAFETRTFVLGTSGATARVRTLWDDEHLYVLAHVSDPHLSTASSNPWEQDSIELFIDANNAQTTLYDGDDAQYRVNVVNERSFGGTASAGRISSATRLVPDGYVVEVAIRVDGLADTASGRRCRDGAFLGFDVQVNDDAAGDGVRTSVATWNDTTGRAYLDPSHFGALELMRR